MTIAYGHERRAGMPLSEPVTRWLEAQSALALILWVGAVWALTTAIWKTFRKAIPALKKLIALSESLERLPEFMTDVDARLADTQAKVDRVHHEVLPNSGGSLRDDVVTISMQAEQIAAQQTENMARVNELEDTITRRIERREELMTAPVVLPIIEGETE